jgi:hypothetical protein
LIAYDQDWERYLAGVDSQGRKIPYGQPGSKMAPPPPPPAATPEPVLPIDEVGRPDGDMLDLMGQSLAKRQEAQELMASGDLSGGMTLLRESLQLMAQAEGGGTDFLGNPVAPPPPESEPEPEPEVISEPEVAPPPPPPEVVDPPVVTPPEPILPIDEIGTPPPVQTGPISFQDFSSANRPQGDMAADNWDAGGGQQAYQKYLEGLETPSRPDIDTTLTTLAMGEEDGGMPPPDMPPPGMATTFAMGEEEDGGMATTLAVGEEDGGMPPPPPGLIEPVAPPPPESTTPPPPEVIDTIGVPPSEYVPPPAFVPPPPPQQVKRPESQYTQFPGQGGQGGMATTRMQGEEEGMTGYTGEGIIGGGQVTTMAMGEEDGGMPFPPTPGPIQPGPSGPDLAGGNYNQQVQGYENMFNNYQNMMPSQIDFSSFKKPTNQGIMAARRKK